MITMTPQATTLIRQPTRRRRQLAWSPTSAVRGESETLSLAPRVNGWQLVTDSGRVVFDADGPDARRQCLHRAYLAGVLRLR